MNTLKQYEITFLTTSEESDGGVAERIREAEGRILTQATPVRKKLAYPIKKEVAAVYWTFLFEIDPKNLPAFNQKLERSDTVLRHLVIADGIRKPLEIPAKKLKSKDLEVAESVIKGTAEFAEAAKAEAAAAQEKPATVATEETTAPAVEEEPMTTEPEVTESKKPLAADELTADERQKKLDEKLKSILGE